MCASIFELYIFSCFSNIILKNPGPGAPTLSSTPCNFYPISLVNMSVLMPIQTVVVFCCCCCFCSLLLDYSLFSSLRLDSANSPYMSFFFQNCLATETLSFSDKFYFFLINFRITLLNSTNNNKKEHNVILFLNAVYLGELGEKTNYEYRLFRKSMNIIYDSHLNFMLVSIH